MPSLSHRDDYFETPWKIVWDIESEIGLKFTLDICASWKSTWSECITNTKALECFHLDEPYPTDALNHDWVTFPEMWLQKSDHVIWCNPPRSKNGKFVLKALEQWKKYNMNIVMLLCWNDLGNKYCKEVLENILNGTFIVGNLGKIIFDKDGKPSEFPSRLTYFWCWFKSKT